MNKSAIQKFAIQARRDLIEQVKQRAYQYGIDETGFGDANAVAVSGRVLSSAEKLQRQELIRQIQQKGYAQEMEEVAYTWFNRFIALRFMEVNNYLPSHIRVFSDAGGSFSPEILKDALHLDLPGLDKGRVAEYIESNNTDDLYRYLLLTQCNALNVALPVMFQRMSNYTEMLLPNNILRPDSVLGHMVADIPEEDWKDQVQIIGWMYQYYNTEPKQAVFDGLKKNIKITKDTIPAATQLFTPDWIVRYMVENSLGRLWTEGHPNAELKAGWKYYLDEAEQEPEVEAQLAKIRKEYQTIKPEEIKVIDPCMGSGHILVYAFDVLMQIYQSAGWDQREAAQSILEHNLYGLDIDDRAAQLAYFAVMMKARQYDRRIFTRDIQPHVYAIEESNVVNRVQLKYFGAGLSELEKNNAANQTKYLLDTFKDAKEYGSILNVEPCDWAILHRYATETSVEGQVSLDSMGLDSTQEQINMLIDLGEILSQKYDVVVTNPPYMGSNGFSSKLSDFVKCNYNANKMDLFACFIEKCISWTKGSGFTSMITMESWMFLSSFLSIRELILNNNSMANLVHMPYLGKGGTSLGINFGTAAFTIRKKHIYEYKAAFNYIRYYETDDDGIPISFPTKNERYAITATERFSSIPGSPVAYWVSNNLFRDFEDGHNITEYVDTFQGIITGDNEKFLRLWFEPNRHKLSLGQSVMSDIDLSVQFWIPYNKGGDFRNWYGNQEYVVNWMHGPDDKTRGKKSFSDYYLREYVSWSYITSSTLACRYFPKGFLWDVAGSGIFDKSDMLYYLQALIGSKVGIEILRIINPTINFQVENIAQLPIIISNKAIVDSTVRSNIELSKTDWDSFETSWDFKQHPLVALKQGAGCGSDMSKWNYTVKSAYEAWESICNDRFNQLKANEEELNRIFIDIYGLQDELTPEEEDKDVTVRKADLGREVRSIISYAVGCMFGRYSLEKEGLVFAGGDWDDSKYITFTPDRDNIIPICDDEYFDDDISGRFVQWVETVYGKETLEENLKFIADALGGKGSPREVIRSYFLNDFYADHLKVYQKRPIYWLFDSGKKNGFKALIYMHRYQHDLLARMRTDYVHEQQERYRTQLAQIGDALTHASGAEAVKLSKRQKKIQEQSLEIQKYEEKIHHLADQNIEIDLDDGVKYNYALFEDVLAKIK